MEYKLNIMVTFWYTLCQYPLPMTIRVCCGKSLVAVLRANW